MRKIYKIPVIGKILHAIAYIKNLPVHLQKHTDRMDGMQVQFGQMQEQMIIAQKQTETMQNQIEVMQHQLEVQEEVLAQQNNLLNQHSSAQEMLLRRIQELDTHNQLIAQLQIQCKGLEEQMPQAFEQILGNDSWINRLNIQLSSHPTVWGKEGRLHISSRAAVSACFFNTNSGEITIGEYTFAGSNVNILAGNHDIYLEGLMRRDAEIKDGCDITIGNGVWLASGCTILGPCTIGDNAVVAAGAVVLPGTDIPSNCVYGGVPAKFLKKIETVTDMENEHIKYAIERENGILFVQGWSEKRSGICYQAETVGHWLIDNNAYVYTNREVIELVFHKSVDEKVELIIKYGTEKKELVLNETDTKVIIEKKNECDVQQVEIQSNICGFDKVFVVVM